MQTEIVVAIIAGIVGVVGSLAAVLVTFVTSERKSALDELSALIDNLQEELERQRARIDALERENHALRSEVALYRAGVQVLVMQIRTAGLEPEWRPGAL